MKSSVFITGVTGFLGKYLLSEINFSDYKKIILLVRNRECLKDIEIRDNLEIVECDLEHPSEYSGFLKNIDTVVHLAAVTGKVKKKKYDRINYQATADLIDASLKNGVKNFLYLSSISVKFKKKRGYNYALSKENSENYLKNSGINYSILRPTMILGSGSPVFNGFYKFTGMPVIPFFGKGDITIQPVHAKDVSSTINFFCMENIFDNRVYELGGPDRIRLDDFVLKISRSRGLKKRLFRIPLMISIPLITIMDKFFYRITPVTMAQISTFRNDGAAKSDKTIDNAVINQQGIDKMITESVEGIVEKLKENDILAECRLFSKYLINSDPTLYVIKKYSKFLRIIENSPKDKFDLFILNFGKKSRFFTRLADSFSRFFKPDSILRKRLGFLFAILETSPEIYKKIDIIKNRNLLNLFFIFSFKGVIFIFSLLLSIPIFMPFKIIKSGKKIRGSEGAAGE